MKRPQFLTRILYSLMFCSVLGFTSTAEAQVDNKTNPGIEMHGFADVVFGHATEHVAEHDRRRSFGLGTFSFYLNPRLDENVVTLFEIAIKSHSSSIALGMERMQLGYAFNDMVTLWTGRFHLPMGYYNVSYHHGAQLQTAIFRPRFIDFEHAGALLPMHTIGSWATGSLVVDGGKWTYDLFGGNGSTLATASGETVLDTPVSKDNDQHSLGGVNFGFKFSSGLKVGVHGMTDVTKDTRLNVYGGYAAYDEDDGELIAEFYSFANKLQATAKDQPPSTAGFIQLGKPFGNFLPFIRYEEANVNLSDTYFAQISNVARYARSAVGLRYNLNYRAALKIEGIHTEDNRKNDEIQAQYAIRF